MAYRLSNAAYYARMKETTVNRTADVQPVRHGRWTDHHCKHIEQLNANLIQAKCTYCGRYSDKIDAYCRYLDLEYCSHCGADMRKETNNG